MNKALKDILLIEDREATVAAAEGFSESGFRVSRICAAAPEPVPAPAETRQDGFGAKHETLGPCPASEPPSQKPAELSPSATVVVQTPIWKADFEGLGLQPGEFVLSLSDFLKRVPQLPPAEKKTPGKRTVAFLLSMAGEGRPSATRDVLEAAPVLLDTLGYRVVVLCGNLKVSGAGLESLYRRARQKGAVFLRFSGTSPGIRQDGDGRAIIECLDETSRLPIILHPALTVVEEAWLSGPSTRAASALLRTNRGPDGFMPSDNVHRLGFKTNRRGVFGLLPGSDPLGRNALEDDLAACMLEVEALERKADREHEGPASIDPGLCARCLTCYRSCPHGAVRVGERVEIAPEDCFACGICEAACPARAIALGNGDRNTRPSISPAVRTATPRPGALVAFGCRRSADRARALCEHLGRELPADLIFSPVECAGRISSQMLMDAFLSDAAGVIVLACHTGNCHAERGNLDARARVGEVQRRLAEIGVDGGRILYHTLAANMGTEFGRVVREFHDRITRSATA